MPAIFRFAVVPLAFAAAASVASAQAVGSEFQVNTYTTSHQTSPSVAASPGGRFVVAWMSYQDHGNDWGVFGQRLAFNEIFADGFE